MLLKIKSTWSSILSWLFPGFWSPWFRVNEAFSSILCTSSSAEISALCNETEPVSSYRPQWNSQHKITWSDQPVWSILMNLIRLAMKPWYNTQSDLTKSCERVLISGALKALWDSSSSYMKMTSLILPLFIDCLFVLMNLLTI